MNTNANEQADTASDAWTLAPQQGHSDSVLVTESSGRSWRVHREDADPEHRFTARQAGSKNLPQALGETLARNLERLGPIRANSDEYQDG